MRYLSSRMKIALAQIDTTVGAFAANAAAIAQKSREAADSGAQLVLFPELTLCGYPPKDLLALGEFVQRQLATLEERLRNIYEQRKDKTMFIAAAGTLRYKDIIDVIDAAKGAGVEKVGIVRNFACRVPPGIWAADFKSFNSNSTCLTLGRSTSSTSPTTRPTGRSSSRRSSRRSRPSA